MPYLEPEDVLERFSRFTVSTVRPAIPETEEFVRGQAGSMASTLRFLAGELEARETAVADQERVLREALADLEERTDDAAIEAAVADATDRLDGAADRVRERETAVLEATDDVLGTVDERLEGEPARAARRPLYGVLDERVGAQLRMLGGEPRSGPDGGDGS